LRKTASSPLDFVRREVREAPAYAAGKGDAPIRLDRNESPAEMPEDMRREVLRRLDAESWSRYADPFAADLRSSLALREGLPPEAVLVGNGSNSLFLSLFLALFGPGRRCVLCPPTFGLYAPWVQAVGGEVVSLPLAEEDLSPPVEEMVEAARKDPALVVLLCSPNNPTGTLFPEDGLRALLQTDALVVLDEAYVEFSGRSARAWLDERSNLVILRTLSKAAALAGARVGYLLADPVLVAEISKVYPPYAVNLFARAAALATLARPDLLAERAAAIVAERDRVFPALSSAGGALVARSFANFHYLRPEKPAAELAEAIRARGVAVRRVAGVRGEALRVTVGRPEENDHFLEIWKEVTR
jgi:histidinol-phosphate aminotransferase